MTKPPLTEKYDKIATEELIERMKTAEINAIKLAIEQTEKTLRQSLENTRHQDTINNKDFIDEIKIAIEEKKIQK